VSEICVKYSLKRGYRAVKRFGWNSNGIRAYEAFGECGRRERSYAELFASNSVTLSFKRLWVLRRRLCFVLEWNTPMTL